MIDKIKKLFKKNDEINWEEKFWEHVRWAYKEFRENKIYPGYPIVSSKLNNRKTNQPCPECGESKGTFLDDGWNRCKNCGFPGK